MFATVASDFNMVSSICVKSCAGKHQKLDMEREVSRNFLSSANRLFNLGSFKLATEFHIPWFLGRNDEMRNVTRVPCTNRVKSAPTAREIPAATANEFVMHVAVRRRDMSCLCLHAKLLQMSSAYSAHPSTMPRALNALFARRANVG